MLKLVWRRRSNPTIIVINTFVSCVLCSSSRSRVADKSQYPRLQGKKRVFMTYDSASDKNVGMQQTSLAPSMSQVGG